MPGSKSRASPCPACELDHDDDGYDDDDDDDGNDGYDDSDGNDGNNPEPTMSMTMILHNCQTYALPLPFSYESCHMKQYKHGRTEAVRCPCFTRA